MTKERGARAFVTISVAAHRTGLSTRSVRRCIQRGLVSEKLTEAELADLRRIRRLTNLGVNLSGVEIILRMRRQIIELQEKTHSKEKINYGIKG